MRLLSIEAGVRRHEFISLVGSAAAWPLVAHAELGRKRIGFLSAYPADAGQALVKCFTDGLADLGWREGQNITVDYRWVGSRPEMFATYAAELVALKPDLIASNSTPAAQALQMTTAEIPIVFMSVSDPVASGIVATLSRPQANLTGVANYLSATAGKLLEFFKTANPGIKRVVVLCDHANPGKLLQVKELETAASILGVAIEAPEVRTSEDITRVFSRLSAADRVGLVALIDGVTNSNRSLIIDLAAKGRIPTAFDARTFVDAGGLMSYGLNLCGHFKRAASYADRILRGKKPFELPIELPTTFELVINLKTARALGVDLAAMLNLADDVIE